MRAAMSGVTNAIAALTRYRVCAPITRGSSGLQYGMSQRRLLAFLLRFGSTYIEGVLLYVWVTYWRVGRSAGRLRPPTSLGV